MLTILIIAASGMGVIVATSSSSPSPPACCVDPILTLVTASDHARELVQAAALAADAKQAEDIVALDVSGPLPLTDVFLLATGRNERNVHAIADEVEDRLLELGVKTLRREGRTEGRWVLLDFGDLVVHVFHEEDRMYYSLERLWKDCPVDPARAPGRPHDAYRAGRGSSDASISSPRRSGVRLRMPPGNRLPEWAVWVCGAAGSAPAWHAGGQGFESPQIHEIESPAGGSFSLHPIACLTN